jgi:hypothetical protein
MSREKSNQLNLLQKNSCHRQRSIGVCSFVGGMKRCCDIANLLSGHQTDSPFTPHQCCQRARIGRFRVAAIDMPGTGESGMALTADADAIYQELLATLAPTGRKAVLGVSFGGHWAAKLALLGQHAVCTLPG